MPGKQPQQPQEPKPTGLSKCPICAAEVDPEGEFFPFCSRRCRMIDLGRWLGGDYKISRPLETRDLEEGLD